MAGRKPCRSNGKAAFALPFFLLAANPPALAAERDSEQLKPTSPWRVDWAPKTCRMQRVFGDTENFVAIQMERYDPSDIFRLAVVGKRLSSIMQSSHLRLAFGDQTTHEIKFQRNEAGDGTPSLLAITALLPTTDEERTSTPVTPEMEAQATKMTLEWGRKQLVLQTGPLDKAFAALRTCTDALVQSWGLDPQVQKMLSRRVQPKRNPATWLRSEDYPSVAGALGKQAIVTFRLSVDATGRTIGCEVQQSYSGESFDRLTCQILMARASFEPALDARRQPVASYYINTVRWVTF